MNFTPGAQHGGGKPHSTKPIQQLVTDHIKKPKIRDPAQRLGAMQTGNAFTRMLRPMLPVAWQYGLVWNVITYGTKGVCMLGLFYSAKLMMYDPTTEEFKKAQPKYDFVRDREGNVVSMAPERVARQVHRVVERSQRFREDSEKSNGW
jgi:hypothetical protein